jgi:hypothetical protein
MTAMPCSKRYTQTLQSAFAVANSVKPNSAKQCPRKAMKCLLLNLPTSQLFVSAY